MPSTGTIYSRFLWGDLSIHIFLMKKKRKREKTKKVKSWWAQFSRAKAKECISSSHKRRALPYSLGFICRAARFMPGKQT